LARLPRTKPAVQRGEKLMAQLETGLEGMLTAQLGWDFGQELKFK
jgi:hypothetical protein